ncbi:hypothetical protein TNCV_2499191 [Trichonephila clavipes]|nr:hypothetical protein TNCV_2499191 [Trichonephila clavipes]
MNSNPVPLKTPRVGERFTLNLSRAQISSRGCGVVVRREPAQEGFLAAETSRIMGRSVSAETVRDLIRHAGYSSRVARKKPS